MRNVDINLDNIHTESRLDHTDCCSYCAVIPGCVAWTFSYSTSTCNFKNDTGPLIRSDGLFAGFMNGKIKI